MTVPHMADGARKLALRLTPEQHTAFQRYRDELVAWNARVNLTAITDDWGIQIKHFLDSVSCIKGIFSYGGQASSSVPGQLRRTSAGADWPEISLVDVGTGAGFPGVPLKIVCPSLRLTLIEATGKKVEFLKHLVATLDLRNVTVLKARAEDVGQDSAYREQHDFAVARAVAEMPTLVEYLLPLVKVGGKVLAQKGESAPAEVASAEKAIHHLGGRLDRLLPLELHGIAETRYLVMIDKVAATPERYPRRPGLPAKRPIR
ncbi:MAG: 16S rRNA (guanine(527)-N(7))-methyltransferase RsmG [Thermoflexales bacterium]|nr:16S rRNA (guanine(527)-N(7))-methyltransferase RsmG [Thermoflexales bacterium]